MSLVKKYENVTLPTPPCFHVASTSEDAELGVTVCSLRIPLYCTLNISRLNIKSIVLL